MKVTRAEKIWLVLAVVFYALYNIPYVPAYGDAVGTIIHGALTVIPLWIVVYVGFSVVCRKYKVKKEATTEAIDKAASEKEDGGDE